MIQGKAVLKGLKETLKDIERAEIAQIRSLNDAFRIEGFRMKNSLQHQIRLGAPGGYIFEPLSVIGRKWKYSRRKNNPLYKLALGIRYHIPNTAVPMLQVGFVGPVNMREQESMVRSGLRLGRSGNFRGITSGNMTSKSYRRLADKHQKGFESRVTPSMRKSLRNRGIELFDPHTLKENPAYRVFFLKDTTTVFKTPARPIIDPFWRQQKHMTISRIRMNYKMKLKGYII